MHVTNALHVAVAFLTMKFLTLQGGYGYSYKVIVKIPQEEVLDSGLNKLPTVQVRTYLT